MNLWLGRLFASFQICTGVSFSHLALAFWGGSLFLLCTILVGIPNVIPKYPQLI